MKKCNLKYCISIEVTPKEELGNGDWYSAFEKEFEKECMYWDGVYYKRPTVVLEFIDGSSKTIYCDTDKEAEKEAERIMKLSKESKTIWI